MLACTAGLLVTGCAHWNTTSDADVLSASKTILPATKMSPDTVVLEIAVAKIPPTEDDLESTLWQQVDEQHLPIDVRHHLFENGFRCALVGMQLPESLVRILDGADTSPADDLENVVRRGGDQTWRERRQSRTGHRYRIVTSPVRQRIDVITSEDGVVRGRTCHQAHCEFALRTYPQNDGSVRIELLPEIHHGPTRQTYVGNDRGFMLDTRQQQLAFDELMISATLSPGQSLLLSTTPQSAGVASHFFSEGGKSSPSKILLVRLAQTQHDDLFAPDDTFAPIATPTE